MKFGNQTTLRSRVSLSGCGVHSNRPVEIVLHPSEAGSGIVFLRTGLADGAERTIQADWSRVSTTELCTVLGESARGAVSTVEHLLAAFAGLGVDNVLVEIDGPEVPILDGSAGGFVEAIDQVGLRTLSARRRYLKVLKPVRVEMGRSFSELLPAREGFRLEVEIDFAQAVIGRQRRVIDLDAATFRRDLARARTFGFVRQVEMLWKAGFALGASLENSIALEDERVLNPEGLRFADEFVRHKALDAVGDLALAGAPIIGAYRSYCGGHRTNVGVLAALFADAANYEMIELPAARGGRHIDFGLAAHPAFAPDQS